MMTAVLVMAPLAALVPAAATADDSCVNEPLAFQLQCTAAQGIASAAGNAVGSVAQFGADQAERALTRWVVDTAVWLLNQLVSVIFNTTSPVLTADWFRAHYADMVGVAWVVAPIFLLLGVVQAVLRADLGMLGRILGQLVVIALLTTGAVVFAQMLIGTTDQLSAFVSRNSQDELHTFLTEFMAGTMAAAAAQQSPAGATVPLAFLFLAGVLTTIGGVLIWLELVARTLVIYAAMLFFPVLLAAALWPKLSGMVQLLAEVLVAVILSKFVIVAIVAMGVAALTATGTQNAGPSLLIGAGLLLVAAWAPWKFYRLMPTLEAAMVHQVGRQFHQGWTHARWRGRHYASRTWRSMASSSSGQLKVAGRPAARPPRPARPQTAGAAAGGAATAGLAVATHAASRVRDRVVGGADGVPRGWQRTSVAGGGHILVPGPGRVRNPRPDGSGPAGGGGARG